MFIRCVAHVHYLNQLIAANRSLYYGTRTFHYHRRQLGSNLEYVSLSQRAQFGRGRTPRPSRPCWTHVRPPHGPHMSATTTPIRDAFVCLFDQHVCSSQG